MMPLLSLLTVAMTQSPIIAPPDPILNLTCVLDEPGRDWQHDIDGYGSAATPAERRDVTLDLRAMTFVEMLPERKRPISGPLRRSGHLYVATRLTDQITPDERAIAAVREFDVPNLRMTMSLRAGPDRQWGRVTYHCQPT